MAKKRKRKIKFGRIFILLILLGVIAGGGYYAYQKMNVKKTPTKEIKNISSIDKYGYTLKETSSPYFKKLFKELEKILNKDEVNEEEYMLQVSKMFVADFFNLDNKVNKSDVGGKQFVYEKYRDDFSKYAIDTMYKSVESNVYGNRKQDLPIVTNVEVEKVKTESFKYGDSTDEGAYVVNFEITYKSDMDYQTSGTLVLIHNDKKIEVASMNDKSLS
ncbi:MAG: hypothetical protein IKG27_04080 [Bacilli bacterium]|nr:hypothetical protein [Bacilli bacterium]